MATSTVAHATSGSSGAGSRGGFLSKLQVKQHKSNAYANNQYVNYDLVPMSYERRTWKASAFAIYWMTGGFAIYQYSTGSALIAYGLSGPASIGACVLSPVLLAVFCVLCGWIGTTHHIGYTVLSRATYGMRGTYLAVLLRLMPGLIWDAIEAFWGGQAVSTMIATWSPAWREWNYPLANGTLQLNDFIGFIIYYVVFCTVMILPPEKLKTPFLISSVGFVGVVIGLLAWSVNKAGGAGPYFASDYQPAAPYLAGSFGWAFLFGCMAIIGNTAVVTLSIADWTRFARNGTAPAMISCAIWCPLSIFIIAVLGIIITSAATVPLGVPIWQPFLLLREIQKYEGDSASARAGVFFAALAVAFAQVCVNIILNSVSAAMDLTALNPKYINIRRGSYLIAAIGLVCNPWELTVNAATFLTVLSGFGNFYGPLTGVLVADVWIVRKRKLNMRHLYIGNSESIYWYWHGVNWRAMASFFLAIIPAMPGYVWSTYPDHPVDAARKISNLGFLVGFGFAFVFHTFFNFISPPAGLDHPDLVSRHVESELILPTAYDQTKPTQLGKPDLYDAEGHYSAAGYSEAIMHPHPHDNSSEEKVKA